jgi:exodeoxyribonuclease VII large subunit
VNVLARGWTITRTADGVVVRSPQDVAAGDVITTQFAAGSVSSRVESDRTETR